MMTRVCRETVVFCAYRILSFLTLPSTLCLCSPNPDFSIPRPSPIHFFILRRLRSMRVGLKRPASLQSNPYRVQSCQIPYPTRRYDPLGTIMDYLKPKGVNLDLIVVGPKTSSITAWVSRDSDEGDWIFGIEDFVWPPRPRNGSEV